MSYSHCLALPYCFQIDEKDERDHIEVSPESGLIIETVSKRISQDGGCSLIIDYGHDGDKSNSLRVKTEILAKTVFPGMM